jgi:hypothetical protein
MPFVLALQTAAWNIFESIFTCPGAPTLFTDVAGGEAFTTAFDATISGLV